MAATSCRFLHRVQLVKTSHGAAWPITERAVSVPPRRVASFHAERQRRCGQKLAYQSEYMTVADVVNHVIQHDGCNDNSALKQIREWLTDASHRGHITFVAKWESMNDYPAAQLWDRPPNDPAFWQKVRICGARVFDPYGNCWRTLWLRSECVRRVWRAQLTAATPQADGSHRKGGPTNPVRNKVKKLLLEHNVDLTAPVKTISKYVHDHWNGGKPPSDRTIVRAIKAAKDAAMLG